MQKKSLKFLSLFLVFSFLLVSIPAYGIDSQSTSLRLLFDKIDAKGGSWYMNSNNDTGTLAWSESAVLEGYLNMYRVTKDTRYLDKFSTHVKGILNQRDTVRGVKDYRGLSLPGWSTANYSVNGLRYVWVVHTGMIVYPMAEFAAIVNNTAGLENYKTTADTFVKAAKDAVAISDHEWVDKGTYGYYAFAKGAPNKHDGAGIPHNQYLAMARAQLAIYAATGEKLYLDRATKMAQHFKNNLKVDAATNAYIWFYNWGQMYDGWKAADNVSVNTPNYGGYKSYEDVSHGNVDYVAVYDFFKAGVVFNQTDMVKFGNTIEKKLLLADGNTAKLVDGSGIWSTKAVMGKYVNFHDYAPSLYNYAYKSLAGATSGTGELLGVSLLNWAHEEDLSGLMPYLGYSPATTPPAPALPSVPSNLTATVTGTGSSVQLKWAASSGDLKYYRVYRSKTAGSLGSMLADKVTGTTLLDSGVREGQTYYYTVTAVNSAGSETAGSSQVTITPKLAPLAPLAVTIKSQGTGDQVELSWTPSTSSDVSFYRVYRSQTQGQQGSVAFDNQIAALITDNVTEGQTYYYTVTAVDAAGFESAPSTQAAVTAKVSPNSPTALNSLVKGTGSQIELSWTPSTSSDVSFYRVYRSQTQGQQGSVVFDKETTALVTDNVTEGQTYYYTVTAVDAAGYESPASEAVTVTPAKAPAAPSALTASAKAAGDQVDLSWTASASSDVSFYRIYRSLIQGQSGSLAADKVSASSWADQGVSSGQKYYYTVTAVDQAGNVSLASNEAGISVPVPPAPQPTPQPTPEPTPAPTMPSAAPYSEQLINGNFSGLDGWTALDGRINKETNGNSYLTNGYNFEVFQEVPVQANANYILKAKTRKGDSLGKARLRFVFVDAQGNDLPVTKEGNNVYYSHLGTGWEDMPKTVVVTPAKAVKMRLFVTTSGNTGSHDFDNLSLKTVNLVVNPEFSDTNGWTGLTGKIKTEPNGNKYLTNGYNFNVYQDIPAAPNTQYSLSAKVRKLDSLSNARIQIIFLDAQGNKLAYTKDANNLYYLPTTNDWEDMPVKVITTPANTASIRLYMTTSGNTGAYDYDDVVLTR